MGKYDKYAKKIKEEREFKEEQDRLHKKHEGIDENKVIVETSNTYKFTLSFLRGALKTTCTIIIFILAAIGLITVIYPNVREELMVVVQAVIDEVMRMIGR